MQEKNLRNYQINLISDIKQAWASGAQNVLAQLPTGGGKTVVLASIVSQHDGYCIIVAHRMELVTQVSKTLAKFGIYHDVLAAKATLKTAVTLHMQTFKKSFYCAGSKVMVAGVDALLKLKDPRFNQVSLLIQDEAHHVLRKNKWGAVAEMFPSARGLYLTATPRRADGHGLGRHADGVIDAMVCGPTMRELINQGHLCDYRIVNPGSNIDLSEVPLSASGDFSPPKLRVAVEKSRIVGDVVSNYLKFSPGLQGVTFASDIKKATEFTVSFREAGVSAEIVTGNTPDLIRASIMRKFENREIMMLVNVDIFGEGVDLPALGVVIFARPTASFALYSQQFGRALRPSPGKTHALIIDHVNNVTRLGLPDRLDLTWSLNRREKRSKSAGAEDTEPLRTCGNVKCLAVYTALRRDCPICGHFTPPAQRSAPEHVDGDLIELDPNVLAKMRGEVLSIDGPPRIPQHLDYGIQRSIVKRHQEKQQAQQSLREKMALWAGYQRSLGKSDSEIYRIFYHSYGVDMLTAQTLKTSEAREIEKSLITLLTNQNVKITVSRL